MSSLLYSVKRNPVLIYSVAVAVLTEIVSSGIGGTVGAVAVVLLGVLTRHFTVPDSEVIRLEEGSVVVTAEGDVIDVDGSTGPLI